MAENSIISVAVHDLRKGPDDFQVVLGKSDLGVTAPVQRVVDQLHTLYGRRTAKSHGKFDEDEDNYPTQRHLRQYLEAEFKDFGALTEALMRTLAVNAQTKAAATGGHVFFAHFQRDGKHYLMVAIVGDALSAALTKQHDVTDVTHLDINGFRFAGRINISGWTSEEDRYIGFLKGKGNVAEYFRAFLGCTDHVQEKTDTRMLVAALKSFADQQGFDHKAKTTFLAKAKEICDRAARTRVEISFDTLTNELAPEDPDTLRDHLADPHLRLNDLFIPNRAILNTLVRFKGHTDNWTLEFDRRAIEEGDVTFDNEKQTLTLKNLPEELTVRLNSEYGDG
ncbi:nucleoid-associated protein [Martelella radicis]|uniref:Nucleoid-associated protein n=1 Tax=Martelella radicis TaxID=1397476 RepID=A0A7W6P9P3_9HYPH|nr:nucleoid-associated protein [Martelella radicis]MBB4120729.1 nucleoid-associated protein [Martelella radicis]